MTEPTGQTPTEIRIASEPDALTRAQACLDYVGRLAMHLDRMEPSDRAMASASGEANHIAGQQRVHVQLAAASAQVAIAEQLTRIAEVLEAWGGGPARPSF
jgi:hypothetical protein